MKKLVSIVLCLAMLLSFAACGSGKRVSLGKLEEYSIEGYKLNLPCTYVANDLVEVKAEPSCIAMLTDSEGKLPDLWIYEDNCQGSTLKEHIINIDKDWDFNEITYYSTDAGALARTVYDEDWYGEALINEHYYRIENGTKVLSFDFAYNAADDATRAHEYILLIAKALDF